MNLKKIVMISTVIFAFILVTGCIDDNTDMINEYNSYMDTYNQDTSSLISKMDAWDLACSMAVADEYLTSEEVEQLAELAQAYVDESGYVIVHANEFKDFIATNEQGLKDEGLDTYSIKKSITDDIVTINQNNEQIKSYVEYMIQIVEYTEDLEVLEAILDLLI